MLTKDEKLIKQIRERIKKLKQTKAKQKKKAKPPRKKPGPKPKPAPKPKTEPLQRQRQRQEVNILFDKDIEIRRRPKKRRTTTTRQLTRQPQIIPIVQPMNQFPLNELYSLQNTFNNFQSRLNNMDNQIKFNIPLKNESLSSLREKRQDLLQRLEQSRESRMKEEQRAEQIAPVEETKEADFIPVSLPDPLNEPQKTIEQEKKDLDITKSETLASNLQKKIDKLEGQAEEKPEGLVQQRVQEIEQKQRPPDPVITKQLIDDPEGESEGGPTGESGGGPTREETEAEAKRREERKQLKQFRKDNDLPSYGRFNTMFNELNTENKDKFFQTYPKFFNKKIKSETKLLSNEVIKKKITGLTEDLEAADALLLDLLLKQRKSGDIPA